jgi:hypothetical protein
VTANIVNKNYTVVVHEIYDEPNNRALFRQFHAEQGDTTSLYLYDLGEYYIVNASGCFGGRISELTSGQMRATSNGRIMGTHEMFRFASADQEEIYMGVENVAGVPCDKWRSVQDDGPTGVQQTIDYYFSTANSGWRWPSAHASQVPVMLSLTGSRPNGRNSTARHQYMHVYEFGHFTVGLEQYRHGWNVNHTFTIPREAGVCVGNINPATVPYAPVSSRSPPVSCAASAAPMGMSAPAAAVPAGAAFVFCLLFLVIGLAMPLAPLWLRKIRSICTPAAPPREVVNETGVDLK